MPLTLRRIKGSALTYDEMDDNFEFLGGNLKAAQGAGLNQIFFQNDKIVTGDYTLPSDKNALTAGPVTIADGVTVTISDGARWVVL